MDPRPLRVLCGALGGTQPGFPDWCSMMLCIFDFDPSLLACESTFPGAISLETVGLSGWPRYLDRMPRAEAKLLAIDDDISLEVDLRWLERPGMCEALVLLPCEPSVAASFSDNVPFSSLPSVGSVGASDGSWSSSARRLWCASSSLSVLSASALDVSFAAFANSPAACVCSLMATVLSDACFVAAAAALAWSCAFVRGDSSIFGNRTLAITIWRDSNRLFVSLSLSPSSAGGRVHEAKFGVWWGIIDELTVA